MVFIDHSVLKNVPEALVTGDSGRNKAKGQSATPDLLLVGCCMIKRYKKTLLMLNVKL